jgi:hypothetical protein
VEYTWHGDALNYYNEVSSLTDEDQDVCCGDKGEVTQFLRQFSDGNRDDTTVDTGVTFNKTIRQTATGSKCLWP